MTSHSSSTRWKGSAIATLVLALVVGATASPPRDARRSDVADNVALGSPSEASDRNPDDYRIARPQYVLSYSRSRGIPNWVAWHVGRSDLGPIERAAFEPDPMLPASLRPIQPDAYRGIGFDRGHMCPAGDRTATIADNAATFLMTNILPQTSDNNQGPWLRLEEYCRHLVRRGAELYVACGGGPPFRTIPTARVDAPDFTWKIVVVLREGSSDLERINASTRVIAVAIPNRSGIRSRPWRSYRTTVDDIERRTGLTFFRKVPVVVRRSLLTKIDAG